MCRHAYAKAVGDLRLCTRSDELDGGLCRRARAASVVGGRASGGVGEGGRASEAAFKVRDVNGSSVGDFVGYHRQARSPSGVPLDWVEIFNAGHSVPMDQPKAALQMIQNWIFEEPFAFSLAE